MESRLDIGTDQLVISLMNDECLAVARGDMISDRNNPFDPMAKVEVAPYDQLDPTYEAYDPVRNPGGLLETLAKVACRAIILNNNDVRIFVPNELVSTNFYSAEIISTERIDADEDVKPAGGIRMEFSGWQH
jgi:hypothetical protein